MEKSFVITKANFGDIDEIYLIEKQNFKFPWSKKSFEEEIKISKANKGIFLVIKCNEEVIGYVCCRIVQEEANIINISVKREFQRLGFATKLLNYLFSNLEKENVKYVYLEVRETNIAARKLYEKLGFEKYLARKNFYFDKEDAILMCLNLNRKDYKDESRI